MMTNRDSFDQTVAFHTLGCKVNTTETEGMRHLFAVSGFASVSEDADADVHVINTCTVTNMGDRRSRQLIRRVHKRNPQAVIAVVGCYAQIAPEQVAAIAGVDIVLGNNRKHTIVDAVQQCLANRKIGRDEKEAGTQHAAQIDVTSRNQMESFEEIPLFEFSEHTRAFLKIQDGCDQFCAYCIIPYARGPVRSRKAADVLAEAERMAEQGFQELVLTGIHLTSYCDETGKEDLSHLICKINAIDQVSRIRLGSLEPLFMTEAFLEAIKQADKLCPHFHLSLQSGSKRTLYRMNRHYTPEMYEQIVSSIRSVWQDAAITTDIMVGFPGETEAEFVESLEFCRRIGFAQMHVFSYSIRNGTPAAGFPDQIPGPEKDRRSFLMTELATQMTRSYRERFLGKRVEVLFEMGEPGLQIGHTKSYIPVHVRGKMPLRGKICEVHLESFYDAALIGHLCDNCMTSDGID